MGITIVLWIVLMFGPGHTINGINYCSLYTEAPTKFRELHETWKSVSVGGNAIYLGNVAATYAPGGFLVTWSE